MGIEVSPARVAQMIQERVHAGHEHIEFDRVPESNSRIVSFDMRLPNGQIFTVRIEEQF